MLTNATESQLDQALIQVNKLYDNNIQFNNFQYQSTNRIRFTLRVKSSKGPGHRVTQTGKRLINACWHVHGHFFDILFDIDPGIWIKSGRDKITVDQGDWKDKNIGSIMDPLYFSQACDC